MEPLFTFGVVADCHYSKVARYEDRYYKDSLAKLEHCIQVMNTEKTDFLVELGDLKERGASPAESLELIDRVEGILHQFHGDCYHVLGNHDLDDLSKSQFLSRIKNAGQPQALAYYAFEHKGWRFLVLDGNYLRNGTDYGCENFSWKKAWVPKAELNWLEERLHDPSLPTIVFIHQRIDDKKYVTYRDPLLRNSKTVRKILEASGCVYAVFQGHSHSTLYSCRNRIHYYTFRGLIKGPGLENASFARVSIFPDDTISVQGYGGELSRTLLPRRLLF